jgi:hypothetical protein
MSNVCSDQKTFNKAVKKAIHHLDDEDDKPKAGKMVMALILLTFYLWALLLALTKKTSAAVWSTSFSTLSNFTCS